MINTVRGSGVDEELPQSCRGVAAAGECKMSDGVGERATPFYCPYCGDEDLRPHGENSGSWRCRACARVFALKFVGLEVT